MTDLVLSLPRDGFYAVIGAGILAVTAGWAVLIHRTLEIDSELIESDNIQ